jgi:hypothetical protein
MFWFGVALHRYTMLVRGTPAAYVPGVSTLAEAQVATAVPRGAVTHCHAGFTLRPLGLGATLDQPAAAPENVPAGRVARVS